MSNLIYAYLYELANTGSVHFTASEPMTEKMGMLIAKAEKNAVGEVSGPFESLKEMYEHLDNF